jgi:hypothetical protein
MLLFLVIDISFSLPPPAVKFALSPLASFAGPAAQLPVSLDLAVRHLLQVHSIIFWVTTDSLLYEIEKKQKALRGAVRGVSWLNVSIRVRISLVYFKRLAISALVDHKAVR